MVQQIALDRTFAALADSTRRDIIARLGEGPATVSELALPAEITVTGMAKHIKVLEDAGLVTVISAGSASSETVAGPSPSRAMMSRRVESASAAKVRSSAIC